MPEEIKEDLELIEIELLLSAITRRYGYDFRNYAPASLRRRIRRILAREGVGTISELQSRILRDPYCMQRFVTNLAVSVTSMFRDPVFYLAFRQQVVPLLRTYPFIRLWHAGCSTGEEVYSIAIVLHEAGLYDRCRIYATDLSDELLDRARSGIYSLSHMREFTHNYLRAGGENDFSSYYTADHKNAILRADLRRHIVFSQHNLVSDGSFNEFHVILCRNVMIYFDMVLRDRVHRLLYESLGMFGILGLGLKESLRYTPHETCYEALEPAVHLYRRLR